MASNPQHLKDHWQESRLFLSRLIAAAVIVLVLTGVLIGRLVQLQVLDYERFSDLSQGNRFKIEPLPPIRGLIFDRNGLVIADNLPSWQLVAVREEMSGVEETLRALEDEGLVNPGEHETLVDTLQSRRAFERVKLSNLTEKQAAMFAVRRHRFPGVDIQEALTRYYPYGEAAAHAIGYVGSISKEDLERIDRADYAGSTQIGKTGLERAYEDVLHGKVGWRQQVRNARGRVLYDPAIDSADQAVGLLSGVETTWPEPGDNIYTSLDMHLQLAAVRALAESRVDAATGEVVPGARGAVVAIDPANGDVLAFVSYPSYDPNRFANGLSRTDYNSLLTDIGKPLVNRVFGGYPPGSTVKPFVALIALEDDIISADKQVYCPGHYSLPGQTHRYRDWKPEGHGSLNLLGAIAQSCDVYFYRLAVDMGIDRLAAGARRFGFGEATGIDISGESSGVVPSPEWKRTRYTRREDKVWFPGETVIAGIGQGAWSVTPIQLAHATATLAARGARYAPRLRVGVENALTGDTTWDEPRRVEGVEDVDPVHWQIINDSMVSVTSGPRGSARARFEKITYSVAGKTGTAQVVGIAQDQRAKEVELADEHVDHGLFVAYAPAEAPTIALAVVVENGGGGSSAAAPVARKILDAYFGGESRTVVELGPVAVEHDHDHDHDSGAEAAAVARPTQGGSAAATPLAIAAAAVPVAAGHN